MIGLLRKRRRMPDFKTCRDKNKGVVMSFYKHSVRQLEERLPLFEATCYRPSTLQAMYLLRRMRRVAEEHDLGFCGFFITDDDKYYYITTTLKED